VGPVPALHTDVKIPHADWYLYRLHKAARICGTTCPCKCLPSASRSLTHRMQWQRAVAGMASPFSLQFAENNSAKS